MPSHNCPHSYYPGRFQDEKSPHPHTRPCLGITPTKSGFDLPSPYESANVFE